MIISPILKLIMLALVVAVIILFKQVYSTDLFDIDRLRSLVQDWGHWAPWIGFLFFLIASILMFPHILIILSISVLYPPAWSVIISLIGGLSAAFLGFYTGRTGGGNFLKKLISSRKTIEKYDLAFRRNEILYVILIRFVPIPYFLQSALCGTLKITALKYGIGSLFELTPWVFTLTLFGEGFLHTNKNYLLIGFVVFILGCFIYYVVIRPKKMIDVHSQARNI